MPNLKLPPLERVAAFQAKVDDSGDCWEWTGARNVHASGRGGYGTFWDGYRTLRAHRVAYELYVGPIPDGMVIDHLCRNRGCVNPAHLEAVTIQENTLRGNGPAGRKARQTHCIRGHEFTPENTYTRPMRTGRFCRTCQRMYRESAS